MKCRYCGGTRLQRRGRRGRDRQRVQCTDCRKWDTVFPQIGKVAKILLLDIETSPIIYPMWSLNQKNFSPDHIIRDWNLLSWAGWWLGRDEYVSAVLTPSEAKLGKDERVTRLVWELLNTSDVVITYNGNNFDLRKLTSKFMEYGLGKPDPFVPIDLYYYIKKNASFTSHKLDYINRKLGIETKQDHEGMPMWLKCMDGDKSALKEMVDYNVKDVEIMEGLYEKVRPWILNHPSMTQFLDDSKKSAHLCSVCLSENIELTSSKHRTKVSEFPIYRCNDCGVLMRGRKSVKNKTKLVLV